MSEKEKGRTGNGGVGIPGASKGGPLSVSELLRRWEMRLCPVCGGEGTKPAHPVAESILFCKQHGAYWDLDYIMSLKAVLEEKGVFPLSDRELSALILALRVYLETKGRYVFGTAGGMWGTPPSPSSATSPEGLLSSGVSPSRGRKSEGEGSSGEIEETAVSSSGPLQTEEKVPGSPPPPLGGTEVDEEETIPDFGETITFAELREVKGKKKQ
ncbi:MAG: hypothetical protein QXH08_00055 [Candidatus Hadarchaeales archaeon]